MTATPSTSITEQSFQVEANGKFFDYLAPGHSIATFKW
jgi:hypothetical protein